MTDSPSKSVALEPAPSIAVIAEPVATPVPNGGGQTIDEADDTAAAAPTTQLPSSTTKPDTQAGSGANAENDNEPTSTEYDPYVTTFFVTGGRFTNDGLTSLPSQLRSMPVRGGTSFLVHLGDRNSPYATRCDEQSYADVGSLFSNSSMPVYFIPGDNDYNGK